MYYLIYLTIGLIYTAVTFRAYREERGSSYNPIGVTVYIVWSVLFWLPMVAYMIFNKSHR